MDTKDLAAAAQEFASRGQLAGKEVPTYIAVMEWLESFLPAAPAPQVEP